MFDPTLAPEGHHIVSMFTQWVPHEWADAPMTAELDAYADRLVDTVDEVAPGFTASILHRTVIGPHEMEHEYGLVGGNIFHGELSPNQLFHLRPAPGYADHRTPIAGLYKAGSATHGGGGVTGIPAPERGGRHPSRRATGSAPPSPPGQGRRPILTHESGPWNGCAMCPAAGSLLHKGEHHAVTQA